MKNLIISKLDVAKRQLETTIRLYFSNGDPVSIHTLTSAAYNVIRDINKKRGGEKLFAKDGFLDYIKEGHEKEVWALINKAENFFKHADRDHDSTIEFNPDQTEYLILEACSIYYKLSGEFPVLFKLYQNWFIANNQNVFKLPEEHKRMISMGSQDVINLGREGYFNLALPIMSKIST
jgi:hypothetical protein